MNDNTFQQTNEMMGETSMTTPGLSNVHLIGVRVASWS
jgi:hypothetical protein